METPTTKLSEAAESGIITTSPALWEEWKRTMEEAFRLEIMKAYKQGQYDGDPIRETDAEQYYEQTYNTETK